MAPQVKQEFLSLSATTSNIKRKRIQVPMATKVVTSLLIVIYGVNNIGKTTQAQKLVDWLITQGYQAEYLKYPIYHSSTGKRISSILREGKEPDISETDFQTIYYENRKEFEPELKTKLDAGIMIVAEDYIGTSLAWGSAKGADYKYLRKLNSKLIQEDLALLMDGERFLAGKEAHHLHEDNEALMAKVREIHLRVGKELGWKIIPANRPVDAVFEDLKKEVLALLQKKEKK